MITRILLAGKHPGKEKEGQRTQLHTAFGTFLVLRQVFGRRPAREASPNLLRLVLGRRYCLCHSASHVSAVEVEQDTNAQHVFCFESFIGPNFWLPSLPKGKTRWRCSARRELSRWRATRTTRKRLASVAAWHLQSSTWS